MENQVEFEFEVLEDISIVRISGELDYNTSDGLRSALGAHIQDGHVKLILDLTDLDFMDSSGMAVMIFAAKRASKNRGYLTLANANPRIARKLNIGGITAIPELLTLYPTVEEAMGHLKKYRLP